MAQIIKASGIEIAKNDTGKLLLRLLFRNLADEAIGELLYSWMPQWDTVRDLMLAAVVVETINQGYGEQVEKFRDALARAQILLHDLEGMMMGQLGIES